MPIIQTNKETVKEIDAEGNEQVTTKETTKKIERSTEPDYIKLYTNMWCEANQIPDLWRPLFLQLVMRMSYANAEDEQDLGGQIVSTGGPYGDRIRAALGWKPNMYQKGLKALCDCHAIKRVRRGFYQVNPHYAGRGEWKYNPRLNRGGIENIIATFDLAAGTNKTEIVWADDGTDTPMNKMYRRGLGVKKGENAILSTSETAAQPSNEKPNAAAKAAPTKPNKTPSSSAHPAEQQTPPQAIVCPSCGESIEPNEYRDKRPGHAGETHWECPLCGADLDELKGAKMA